MLTIASIFPKSSLKPSAKQSPNTLPQPALQAISFQGHQVQAKTNAAGDFFQRSGTTAPYVKPLFGAHRPRPVALPDTKGLEANIPLVDMRDFLSGNPQRIAAFVKTFGDGLRDVGFVALKGHGIPKRLMDQHYRAMEQMFKQTPSDTLNQFVFLKQHGVERGYQPPGGELKPVKLPSGQTVMRADPKHNWMTGNDFNVFPRQSPQMARVNLDIFKRMEGVGMKLVEALGSYLEDDRGILKAMVHDASSGQPNGLHLMRAIHYLPAKPDILETMKPGETEIRTGEHQDISFFTLLPQATESGLQLKQKDGSWLTVFAQQGMIIVNAGDTLKYLTQNLTSKSGESRAIVSTPHRVVGDKETYAKDRFSNPFFFNVNLKGPVKDLRTGEPIRVVIPEKDIDVTLDEGLKFLYARFRKNGTVGPEVPYDAFRTRYNTVGESLVKAVSSTGADAMITTKTRD